MFTIYINITLINKKNIRIEHCTVCTVLYEYVYLYKLFYSKSSIFNFYVVDNVKEHKQTKQKKISLILRSVRIQLSKIGQ